MHDARAVPHNAPCHCSKAFEFIASSVNTCPWRWETRDVAISAQEFDRFLVDISESFMTRQFEPWRKRIRLPFSLVTRAGPVVLNTDEEVFRNYELYLSACDVMRIDTVVREPISLEDCEDGTFLGTYKTHLISRSVLATEPYVSTALLHDSDGFAQMSSVLNARGHHDWTGARGR